LKVTFVKALMNCTLYRQRNACPRATGLLVAMRFVARVLLAVNNHALLFVAFLNLVQTRRRA
jgi:hypothetical protein